MDNFKALRLLLEGAEMDTKAFYEKGNKAAGTRLRKTMLEVKQYAQDVRQEVSSIKQKA